MYTRINLHVNSDLITIPTLLRFLATFLADFTLVNYQCGLRATSRNKSETAALTAPQLGRTHMAQCKPMIGLESQDTRYKLRSFNHDPHPRSKNFGSYIHSYHPIVPEKFLRLLRLYHGLAEVRVHGKGPTSPRCFLVTDTVSKTVRLESSLVLVRVLTILSVGGV